MDQIIILDGNVVGLISGAERAYKKIESVK